MTSLELILIAIRAFFSVEYKLPHTLLKVEDAEGSPLRFSAFSNIGGDFNTYYSTYVEHMVGVDNQLANAVAVITSAKMNLAGTLVVWSLSLLMLSIVSSEQEANATEINATDKIPFDKLNIDLIFVLFRI